MRRGAASSLFRDAVIERDVQADRICWGCEIDCTTTAWATCRSQSLLRDAHHLIPQRVLRLEFPHGVFLGERDGRPAWLKVPFPGAVSGVPVRSLEQLLDDPRNGVMVGRWHHERIESHRTIPLRHHLPADVWAFAIELDIEWMLERWYPVCAVKRSDAA